MCRMYVYYINIEFVSLYVCVCVCLRMRGHKLRLNTESAQMVSERSPPHQRAESATESANGGCDNNDVENSGQMRIEAFITERMRESTPFMTITMIFRSACVLLFSTVRCGQSCRFVNKHIYVLHIIFNIFTQVLAKLV